MARAGIKRVERNVTALSNHLASVTTGVTGIQTHLQNRKKDQRLLVKDFNDVKAQLASLSLAFDSLKAAFDSAAASDSSLLSKDHGEQVIAAHVCMSLCMRHCYVYLDMWGGMCR